MAKFLLSGNMCEYFAKYNNKKRIFRYALFYISTIYICNNPMYPACIIYLN